MVLGDPEAPVAPVLSMGGEVSRVIQRPTSIGVLGDADEIQDR
jgi:hypothetical protein